MKHFLSVLLWLALTIPALAQVPQGTLQRSTNGFGFGTTTIGGRLLATNTVANGGSNQIRGSLRIGETNLAAFGTETLLVNTRMTNPTTSIHANRSHFSVAHTTENSTLIHNGVVSVARISTNNTADWTVSGYPGLAAFSGTVQPEIGSSGTIRRVAAFSGTIGGAPATGGAILDESVIFWGDTTAGGIQLTNVIGLKLSGIDAGENNTAIWLGLPQDEYPAVGNWGIYDITGYPSYFTNNITIGSTDTTNRLNVVAGTLNTQSKSLNVSGTLAASAATEIGSQISITGSGSGANQNRALDVTLAAGYTGSANTYALRSVNSSLGTGANVWGFGAGNYGAFSQSAPATVGNNVGFAGTAFNSSTLNLGVFGRATSSSGSPTFNVGIAGHALNGATANVGGFFGLIIGAPATLTSSALIADNGALAANIEIWRDNGTIIGGIADGGVLHGDASGLTNLYSLWWTNPISANNISNSFIIQPTAVALRTNSFPVSPNFTTGVQLFSTNASFTFLAPAGVDTTQTQFQETRVYVTNTTAAAIEVFPPANVHTLTACATTWFVTNLTEFKFSVYAGKFTNALAIPWF